MSRRPRQLPRRSPVVRRTRSWPRLVSLMTAVLALTGSGLALSPAPAGADPSVAYFFSSDEVGTSGTTPSFAMNASWTLGWSYSCSDYAQGGSFSLTVEQTSGDQPVGPGVSSSGVQGGDTVAEMETGSFTVNVTSACSWTLEAYSGATTPVVLGPPELFEGPAKPNPTSVGIATDPGGNGIWTVRADGLVEGLLGAIVDGDPAALGLNAPIVSVAAGHHGGYDVVGSDGGVFNYGGGFYGSTGGMRLNRPVDGMAFTRDGMGYWLVASDGGVFSFGDAPFLGSAGSLHLNQPVVGIVASGTGYTLVAADGGVFNYGTTFLGSLGSLHLDAPIVGMASTPDGGGYWLLARDGGVFCFGDAPFLGSGVGSGKAFAGITSTPDGSGYWLVASDGTILNFGRAAPA
jgi:hypothetical protein